MKNKKLKYILLPLVFVIWGIIIVRIIAYLRPSNEEIILPQQKKVESKQSREEHFELLMTYKDPFESPGRTSSVYSGVSSSSPYGESSNPKENSKTNNRTTSKRAEAQTRSTSNNSTKQEKKLPVEYLGMVNNSNPAKQTAYIVYENNYILCEPGENIKDITIQSFTNDEITILANDSTYIFKKSTHE